MLQTRISVPSQAQVNEIVEIKTLISHPMESGYRRDNKGRIIPRDIIQNFSCEYLGESVFEAEFGPGIAANPFLSFFLKVRDSGDINFVWTDQHGSQTKVSKYIEVVR